MEDLKQNLSSKMTKEIELGMPYEASQLAISTIARKKKAIGNCIVALTSERTMQPIAMPTLSIILIDLSYDFYHRT